MKIIVTKQASKTSEETVIYSGNDNSEAANIAQDAGGYLVQLYRLDRPAKRIFGEPEAEQKPKKKGK